MFPSLPIEFVGFLNFCFSFRGSVGLPLNVGNRRQWLSSMCWVNLSGTGADSLFDDSPLKENENGSFFGGLEDSTTASFKTVDAEITPETVDFFVSDAEGDPDCPSLGFSSIQQALNSLRQGKVGTILLQK